MKWSTKKNSRNQEKLEKLRKNQNIEKKFQEKLKWYNVEGGVNIYGNTGPGNERWLVVKFGVAPLIINNNNNRFLV